MAMLHTMNKSPFERNTLTSCLNMAKKGSSVLLIEDGVLAAVDQTAHADQVKAAAQDVKFYVLGPDIRARGLDEKNIIDHIEVVDYEGFVDLVAAHDKVQAWL